LKFLKTREKTNALANGNEDLSKLNVPIYSYELCVSAVHAIDHYISLRRTGEKMDTRLEKLLNGLFRHSLSEHQYRHALGIAIETQRMDWFSEAIAASVS